MNKSFSLNLCTTNLQILEIFIKIFHFVFCYKDFGYSSLISVPSVAKIRLSILMCREDEERM